MMPPYAPDTQDQTVDYGGFTWKGQPGGGWTKQSVSGGGSSGTATVGQIQDPIALAKAAQELQIKANQPAINTLTTQKTDLATKYQDLLDSITKAEQPTVDVATASANAANAARGLTPGSEISLKNLAGILAPISTSFGQLKSQTGLSETQDLSTLAAQIAGLQAGNVPGALTFGQGITTAQQQAAAQIAAAQAKPYTPLNPGQALGNTITGNINVPTFTNPTTTPSNTTLNNPIINPNLQSSNATKNTVYYPNLA